MSERPVRRASQARESLEPSGAGLRRQRRRLPLKGELALAALPTATVLGVLAPVEALTTQRLLFASLASSAFLIYLDPEHGTNRVRVLVLSQSLAAGLGWSMYATLGAGYAAAATAMSFALRAGDASNLLLFILALGMTVVLIVLQRAAVWTLVRLRGRSAAVGGPTAHGPAPRATPQRAG